MNLIGLVDCNNFFVSCERLFRPDLARTPVVVLSSNDGCVVSRSQEVKDKGIPMGAPYFQVKDTLSHMKAVVFSSHFTLYRDISRRVFAVVRREVGDIEEYSIDEAFFTIDSGQAAETAARIRAAIAREVGIPVSVGIGLSKTQAKYANALAKKTTGVVVLDRGLWEDRQHEIRLSDLWGVGKGRTRQFTAQGLVTVADYLALSYQQACSLFGVEGARLWSELAGLGRVTDRITPSMPKTLMSTRSFAQETTDLLAVQAALSYHLHQVVAELARLKACTASLRVMVYPSRFGDFALQGISEEVVLPVPTRDIFLLSKEVNATLGRYYRPGVPYKKAGISVAVKSEEGISATLFPSVSQRSEAVSDLLQTINERLGREVLTVGLIGGRSAQGWWARADRRSPAYTTDWDSLCVVHAKP